ncbi:MAG: hypothetical protein JNK64_11290 [Myxococcales bacterium]|nr:hypothetical protein [Myxococcales bacterium]
MKFVFSANTHGRSITSGEILLGSRGRFGVIKQMFITPNVLTGAVVCITTLQGLFTIVSRCSGCA